MRTLGMIALVAALMALLAASLWYAVDVLMSLEAAALPLGIYLAMAGGIRFSPLVGIGLMALVLYSSRRGYDERASSSDLSK